MRPLAASLGHCCLQFLHCELSDLGAGNWAWRCLPQSGLSGSPVENKNFPDLHPLLTHQHVCTGMSITNLTVQPLLQKKGGGVFRNFPAF